jgi:hypothetical protein
VPVTCRMGDYASGRRLCACKVRMLVLDALDPCSGWKYSKCQTEGVTRHRT